jgi:hypothetical protein
MSRLGTLAMNSCVHTAKEVHQVYQGMAMRCDPQLPSIPEQSAKKLLDQRGDDLTPVRILEVLVWTETGPSGGYRS